MTTLTVYQLDADGFYVGPVEADESPLQPGEFLIPGGCVLTVPPGDTVGMRPRWVEGAWALASVPSFVPPRALTADELLLIEREGMEMSFAQMLIGLEAEAWITTEEATAWLVNRVLPPPVLYVISQLPADQQFAATARAVAPSVVKRTNPLVDLLGAVASKTPTQVDQFFRDYKVV
jgi:hypothetical protein